MTPGEIVFGEGPIVLMEGQPTTAFRVENTGDRPVQVGSHFHFAEVNSALQFDRAAATGMRLAIAAGTSVRFEPGIALDVELVRFGGSCFMAGFRGDVRGTVA